METLHQKISFFLLTFLFIPIVSSAFQFGDYGMYKMNSAELNIFNKLSAYDWKSENLTREDKVVNINNINGEIKMSFSVKREQNIGSKRRKRYRKFRYSVGGTVHETNFTIVGDTIHFHGYRGWNDCKIIELKKDKLILEQDYQNSIVRWNLIPQKRIISPKSDTYDFKREIGKQRKLKKRNK